MLKLTLADINKALGYEVYGDEQQEISGICIDSRQVNEKDLFVAIKGEYTDGHRYLKQALMNGASAVAISDKNYLLQKENILLTDDGIVFIQKLAAFIRQQLTATVIAITGSSGKTTSKDMLFNILSLAAPTVAPVGNHNNELGLPLTVLKSDHQTKYVVLEMGMRGLGQIDFLGRIAKPNYGIITNIGTVHSEFLGSKENIARAKAELLAHIAPEGAVYLNEQDRSLLKQYHSECQGHIYWFGLNQNCDIWADHLEENEKGISFEYHTSEEQQCLQLSLNGQHNVENALPVIAIARQLGISWTVIAQGLKQNNRSAMRMERMQATNGALLINDAYNANPQSMIASLTVLAELPYQRKIAVLGDMYELGQYEQEGHFTVGQKASELAIDIVIAVGKLGRLIGESVIDSTINTKVYFATDNAQAALLLQKILLPNDVVLLKGSRGMKMEEIAVKITG